MSVRVYRLSATSTPATSFDLTTVLNVVTDLNLDLGDDTLKLYIRRLIHQASRAAAQYCNRDFALQGYTDTFNTTRVDGIMAFSDFRGLFLANLPLVDIISVSENGTALTAGVDYEVDSSRAAIYRLDSTCAKRASWSNFPVVIVYRAGWTLPLQSQSGPNKLLDFAPDVEDAVIRMIKSQTFVRQRNSTLKSESIPGVISREWQPINVGANMAANMPPDAAAILNNYKFDVFA